MLGWPPKSFQPGILLPPSLPLPALRPPGRWKQNLGSSGLEGRGGNLLHGGKMSPARFLPSPRGTRAPDFLCLTSPVAPSAPPGSPEPPTGPGGGLGGGRNPRSEAAAFSAPCVRQGRAPSLWKGSRIYGKGPEVPPTPVWSPSSPPGLGGGKAASSPGGIVPRAVSEQRLALSFFSPFPPPGPSLGPF